MHCVIEQIDRHIVGEMAEVEKQSAPFGSINEFVQSGTLTLGVSIGVG